MRIKKNWFLVLLFSMVLFLSKAEAEWAGPVDVATGARGSKTGQLGMAAGATDSLSATITGIQSDGTIMIEDKVNKRFLQFSGKGKYLREVQGLSGLKYPSSTIKATAAKADPAAGRISVVFLDGSIMLESDRTFSAFVRDAAGFVYGIGTDTVWRFSKEGKREAELVLPPPHEELLAEPDPNKAQRIGVYVEYSEPVVAPNGDVYALKTSDTRFWISRWTWSTRGPSL